MRVIFAYYGLSCAGDNLKHTVQYQSTAWARKICDGKEFCTGQITTGTSIGDPYHGCNKDFLVIARCGNGELVADYLGRKADNKHFSLACHVGSKVY